MNCLNRIMRQVNTINPVHSNNLRKYLEHCEKDFIADADWYLKNYIEFLTNKNFSFEYMVSSYLEMVKDILIEQTRFLRTGRYRYSSLADVETNVYHNHEYMTKYMIGVALSQFLWENHRQMFLFFKKNIRLSSGQKYLEIGPGHGFFFIEALKSRAFEDFTAVDISKTSLDLTAEFVSFSGFSSKNVVFFHSDVMRQRFDAEYNFVCCGEVLEHLENPLLLLAAIHRLLANGGRAYISTCSNSPAVDHIHLYHTVDEIRMSLESVGLITVDECIISNDKIPQELWEQEKSNVSYACIVRK